jgi:hypothetical protein
LAQETLPYAGYTLDPVSTPEGIFPTDLQNIGPNVIQAISDLNTAILAKTANGGDAVVFGDSESATFSYLEQIALSLQGDAPRASQLSFISVADPSNLDGGLFERILPTPIEAFPYHTDVYTQEYDGFADFPKYPADTLADLNALAGIVYEHLTYADLTQQQIADAIPLASTDPNADYFVIPTDYLPLLEPLRLLGEPGNQLADALQPDLSILVNLGYGNLSETEGYDLGPANVATGFEAGMPNVDPQALESALETGWQQGMTNAMNDVPASQLDSSSLATLEETAYTFGITDTPTPTLSAFLDAVGAWGANELGFGTTFAGEKQFFTNLQDAFSNLQSGYTNIQDLYQELQADFVNVENLFASLGDSTGTGTASAVDALTSGALDATPVATSLSDLATDFLSQLPGLF